MPSHLVSLSDADMPEPRTLLVTRIGPVFRMTLMDGSTATVIASRHGVSYGRTMRRAITANLDNGGGAMHVVSDVHGF